MGSEEMIVSRLLNSNATTSDLLDPDNGYASDEGYSDVFWMLMWFLSLAAFICCPFCGTAKRRELCMRRIQERRWIEEEMEDELDREAARRQQARRQQLDDQQRRFQVSRTQEDEIREQFLSVVTENFSTTLASRDIYESDHKLVRSSSMRSVESQRTVGNDSTRRQSTKIDPADDDIEAAREKLPTGDQSDDEDDFLLMEDFQQTKEVIRVPLPGQPNDSEERPRFVPNGCAICLSKFEGGEEMTWASNPDCSHVFHRQCVIQWYLAVGRKAQQRRQRLNPNMGEMEVLDSICKFQMLCPCCRQIFCANPNDDGNATKPETTPETLDENASGQTELAEQESSTSTEES